MTASVIAVPGRNITSAGASARRLPSPRCSSRPAVNEHSATVNAATTGSSWVSGSLRRASRATSPTPKPKTVAAPSATGLGCRMSANAALCSVYPMTNAHAGKRGFIASIRSSSASPSCGLICPCRARPTSAASGNVWSKRRSCSALFISTVPPSARSPVSWMWLGSTSVSPDTP